MTEERPVGQRYETMQCFALTQPRAMMEEGEGKIIVNSLELLELLELVCLFCVCLFVCLFVITLKDGTVFNMYICSCRGLDLK